MGSVIRRKGPLTLEVAGHEGKVGRRTSQDRCLLNRNVCDIVADHVTKDSGVVPAVDHPARGGIDVHLLAEGGQRPRRAARSRQRRAGSAT